MGTLYVGIIGSFPSTLNMLLIPDGDYDRYIEQVEFNYNLRRLGCSSRSTSLSIEPPNEAVIQRFFQLYYRPSDLGSIQNSIYLFVKCIQTALYIYGLLQPDWIDGLCCDHTLSALQVFYYQFHSFEMVMASLDKLSIYKCLIFSFFFRFQRCWIQSVHRLYLQLSLARFISVETNWFIYASKYLRVMSSLILTTL
jgi:hypothetical protein